MADSCENGSKTVPTSEDSSALSEEKQEKLLKLLGGKKAGNTEAASEWVKHCKTADEEIHLKHDLEAQYNAALSHKLSGKSRRHEGIGFHSEDTAPKEIDPDAGIADKILPEIPATKKSPARGQRSRSRSPIKKDGDTQDKDKQRDKSGATISKPDATTKTITKKNFYMQFTKAKE